MTQHNRKLDIKEVTFYIINLEKDKSKRLFMKEQMEKMGLKYEFITGIQVSPGIIGVALSHLKALRTKEIQLPFAILEDDCAFIPERIQETIEVPFHTDGLYLGHSYYGVREKDQYGLQWGKYGAVKYTIYDDDYLRIYSMLARHAIVFLSERFWKNAIKANVKALTYYLFPHPGDMAYAEMQKDHFLLTPHQPWCYQSSDYGGQEDATKRSILDMIQPMDESE
jgi:hypothetical protein